MRLVFEKFSVEGDFSQPWTRMVIRMSKCLGKSCARTRSPDRLLLSNELSNSGYLNHTEKVTDRRLTDFLLNCHSGNYKPESASFLARLFLMIE